MKRCSALSETRSGGTCPKRYASRASFCCCRARPEPWRWITSGKRSTGPANKVRYPGNSAPPRASLACCGIRADRPMTITTEPSATAGDQPPISFGPFRLLSAQRLLLEGDTPVRLGGRAFDILAALVERAGEVVGKEELIARAWPQTFVEDSNLKIQVSALRRTLGDGQDGHRYVVTVPGRGYNFVAPVHHGEPARAALPPAVALEHNLPLAMTRMIGREEAVAALVSRLSRERLLTIVGPG